MGEPKFKVGDPVRIRSTSMKGVVEFVFQDTNTREFYYKILFDTHDLRTGFMREEVLEVPQPIKYGGQ